MSWPRSNLCAALCLFTLTACNAQVDAPAELAAEAEAAEAPANTVILSTDEVMQLGIVTMPVASHTYVAEAEGYGTVTSLELIAEIDSELANAEAAVRQSQTILQRFRNLTDVGGVSGNELDNAERQASDDTTQLALARRKASAAFGTRAPWLVAGARAAQMARFTAGDEVLVRVVFPFGVLPGRAPTRLMLAPLDRSVGPLPAQPVWEAPADPAIPGRSYFTIASGRVFAVGERISAAAPTGTETAGILMPADAIVFSQGGGWSYVQTEPGTFVRRAVDMTHPVSGGYFVTMGFAAGDMVVTNGSGLLLARELNPSTEVEE